MAPRKSKKTREPPSAPPQGEQRYRNVVNLASTGLVQADASGRMTLVNQRWCEMLGYAEAELLQMNVSDVTDPEVLETTLGAIRRLAEGGPEFVLDKRYRRKDGSMFWARSSVNAVRDAAGQFQGLIAAVLDISDHKRVERKLQDRAQRLSAEVQAMNRLHRLTTNLLRVPSLAPALEEVLHAAIQLLGADFGLVQMLDADGKTLRQVATYGFEPKVARLFLTASVDSDDVAAQAVRAGERVVIEDLELSATCKTVRPLARKAGVRAVQASLLTTRSGEALGVLSTYFRQPHRPTRRDLHILDLYIRQGTDLIERLRADAAVRASERNFATAFAHAPFALVIVSLETGKILEVNQGWTALSGYSREETIGRRAHSLEVWADPQIREQRMAGLRAGEVPPLMEVRFRTKAGDELWGLIGSALVEINGRPCVLSSVTDLTQRKRAEEELRLSDKRHRFLEELSYATQRISDPDRIMALTARMLGEHLNTDRCVYAEAEPDQDHLNITGDFVRGVQSIVGRRRLSDFGPEILRALRNNEVFVVNDVAGDPRTALFLETYQQSQALAAVAVPLLKEARLRAILAVNHQTARNWSSNEIELMQLVANRCWEAIERARAVRALRASEARQHAVVNSSLDAIVIMDHRGEIVEWNPAAEKIFGWPRAKVIGTALSEAIVPPALRKRHREGLQHYLNTGKGPVLGRRIEIPALQRDGSQFPAELSISAVPDADPPLFVGTIRDITERRQTEQALLDNARRKDEFLATLAHELRNPLAPIRNALILLRVEKTNSEVHEMMERQVNHMVRLVDDLLELSRISRGKIELIRERVELSAVIKSALETTQPLIQAGSQKLIVNLPKEQLMLNADPVRLTQVLANLLNNAAKYTPPGGRIELSASRDASQLRLAVSDSGAGIPDHMLPHVFEMFTQVDRTLNRAQGGLGIGLALARNLVELHGGQITVRSDGPGKGSEFIIHLPIAENSVRYENDAPAAPADERSSARNGKLKRVLVVDDNRDAANSLGMLLKTLGAEVQVVYGGAAALAAVDSYQPAVILLDLGMPDVDGFEVARRLRTRHGPELTLIALTGWGQEQDRRRTHDAGFDHHLVKPPDIAALQALLASSPGEVRATGTATFSPAGQSKW